MMQHLGFDALHDCLLAAIEAVLREGSCLTRDMGGTAGTEELTRAVVEALR